MEAGGKGNCAIDTSSDGGAGSGRREGNSGEGEGQAREGQKDEDGKMHEDSEKERESEAGGDRQKLTQRGCSDRQGLFFQPGTQPERWWCRQTRGG